MFSGNKKWYYLAVSVILLFSYLMLSPVYSNNYNSDKAVHVLMAHDFKWHDLYYWGQDRLGSFLPMVASLLVRFLGFSPIYAVSIVEYGLLLGGFLFFSSFIRRWYLRIFLCILWFFPMSVFGVHLEIGHPYTTQLFFLGCSLYCFNRHFHASRAKANYLLFISALSFMLSGWINDLMMALLPLYLGYALLCLNKPVCKGEKVYLSISLRPDRRFFFLLGGIAVGCCFLMLAKQSAKVKQVEYDTIFSSMSQIMAGFKIFGETLWKVLAFRVFNVCISFHTVFFLATLLLLVIGIFFRKEADELLPFRCFILLLAVTSLFVVISSRWVELAEYTTRYFSITYYLGLVFLILMADSIQNRIVMRTAAAFLIPVVLFPAIDAVINASRQPSGYKEMRFTELKELANELGDCGILGDYWASYNIASANPDAIVASPNDAAARNPDLVPKLMQKKTIYLVAENWLSEFPPIVIQFGYLLEKNGQPFVLHGLTFCRYRNTNNIKFPLEKMASRHAHLESAKDSMLVKNDSVTYVNDFIFFGPFITLRPGKYHLNAELGACDQRYDGDTIRVDGTNSFGRAIVGEHVFVLNRKASAFREKIQLDFELNKLCTDIEFRVFLKGRAQVYLKNMTLVREGKLRKTSYFQKAL